MGPAPALLCHSGAGAGRLLASQACTRVPAGREGPERGPPRTAGHTGSGTQKAWCPGNLLTVIRREAPDAFALNCLN